MLSLHIQHVQKHPFSKILAFPFRLALLWLWLAQVVQGNQLLYPFCWGCMILSQVCFVCCSHLWQLMLCISDTPYKQWGFLCCPGVIIPLMHHASLWGVWLPCGGACIALHFWSISMWFLRGHCSQLFLLPLFSTCQTHLTLLFLNLRYYHRWWLWYPSVKSTVVQDKDWNSESGKEEKNF